MSWRCLAFCCMLVFFSISLASAQDPSNPPDAPCGLPAAGDIVTTETFTLTGNCTQTGELRVGAGVSLTIDGRGFTIDGTDLDEEIIEVGCTGTISASNVTFLGGGKKNAKPTLHIAGDSTLSDVTFRDSVRTAFAANACAAGKTHTFTSVLFENSDGVYFHFEEGGSAIDIFNGASLTVTDLVVRKQYGGSAVINAWLGGSITINGCFGYDRIWPQLLGVGIAPNPGSITDNSRGACSGEIGNDDDAVVTVAAPQPAPCGLPAAGYLEYSKTYYLNRDCQQSGTLFIPKGVDITIYGNGRTITGPSSGVAIQNAGDLKLYNARLTTSPSKNFLFNFLPYDSLLLEDVIFSGNSYTMALVDTRATLNRVKFENNTTTDTRTSAASAIRIVRQSAVTIRDSVFRNNSNGAGAIWIGGKYGRHMAPSLTLEGCVTWEGNTPANIAGDATLYSDNTAGTCSTFTFPGPIWRPPQAPDSNLSVSLPVRSSDSCESDEDLEAFPIGVMACLFRSRRADDSIVAVYGVNDDSEGFHLLTVTQRQVDTCPGECVVATSPDGRALVVVWPDRNVTIKVGPDNEDRILHLTFGGGLGGPVISFITTFGPAPGLPYLKR